MNRRTFSAALFGSGMALASTVTVAKGNMNQQKILDKLNKLPNSPKMPALFLGHGSPINAITETEFGCALRKLGHDLPRPNAILCVSAHWLSEGSQLTAMPKPRTIHDFRGFPAALHNFQYPADGSSELALTTQALLGQVGLEAFLDHSEWGLDHGTWSVLTHLFPHADVPVVQLSLDYFKTPQQHYDLAKQLNALRHKGVLIVGSGNVVHNLGKTVNHDEAYFGFDWALAVDDKVKNWVRAGNHQSLINYEKQGKEFALAIPTNEHYLPLLYILAQQDKHDGIHIFNDKAVNGAITMTSVAIGV